MVQLYHKAVSCHLNCRDKIYLLREESFKKRLSRLTLVLHVNHYVIKKWRVACKLPVFSEKLIFPENCTVKPKTFVLCYYH